MTQPETTAMQATPVPAAPSASEATSPPEATSSAASSPTTAPPRRGRLRLHFSTWVILSLLAAALLVLNWGAFAGYDFVRPVEFETWEHGWPWRYLTRESRVYPPDARWRKLSSWSFTDGEPSFELLPLLGNLVVALGLLALSGYLLERRRRLLAHFWQFGLLHFLALTALVAALTATYLWQRRLYEAEEAVVREHALRHPDQPDAVWFDRRRRGPHWLRELAAKTFLKRELAWGDRASLAIIEPPGRIDQAARLTALHSLAYVGEIDPELLLRLEQCSELEVLSLYRPSKPVVELSQLPRLPRLRLFETSHVRWNGAGLENLPALDSLGVAGCELPPEFWSRLVDCSRLRWLGLDISSVDDDDLSNLARLPRLEHLRLSATKITSAGAECLTRCRNLKTLHIYQTEIDEAGLRRLAAALPDCEIVTDLKLTPGLPNVRTK